MRVTKVQGLVRVDAGTNRHEPCNVTAAIFVVFALQGIPIW